MTTDLTTTTGAPTALTIADDQAQFTPTQVAALQQLGVANATPADLDVFFHVAKRTGLDPFAKQIYMITRMESVPPAEDGGQWRKVPKQTIQTGIDGYRLIARRAADQARIKYSVSRPIWYDSAGDGHPLWIPAKWGQWPTACEVTITRLHRDGSTESFPAVVMFSEYVQTTGNAQNRRPNRTWETRPAGQLAKCAEAAALRMAFPHDLSGVYVDAEVDVMEDAPHRVVEQGTGAPVTAPGRLRARMHVVSPDEAAATAPAGGDRDAEPDDAEVATMPQAATPDPAEAATEEQIAAIATGFRALGIRSAKDKVGYVTRVLAIGAYEAVPTPQTMTTQQAAEVITSMDFDRQQPPEATS